MKPSTQKVVERIVDDYRRAGKTTARAEAHAGHPANFMNFMNQADFEADAQAIEDAYNAGKIDTVPESEVQSLMEKYGATDIYHLTASYFNATGKILSVE